jgi:hypothetical protein
MDDMAHDPRSRLLAVADAKKCGACEELNAVRY